MQTSVTGSDECSERHEDSGAIGVLEDPHRVEISRDDRELAVLEISTRTEGQATGVYSKDRFAARIYRYERLYWKHTAALLLLQGATVQQVLGEGWVVVDGKPTVAGDPRPGLEQAVVAHILENPGQLTAQHLFLELRAALKL